jgi:hypothetical protein
VSLQIFGPCLGGIGGGGHLTKLLLLVLLLFSSHPLLSGAQFGGTQNPIIPRVENSSVPLASKKTYKK